MSEVNTTCLTRVYRGNGWHGRACGNSAKHEHEGVMYCKLHHPPTVKAKEDAKQAEWSAKVDRRIAANREAETKAAEQRRRAECFPDLLEALQAMVESYEHEASIENPALLQARAVIAKATQ